ncbi:MAG: DUF3311 domain-containing protein [Candidatus Eremiobacteraeota bacterium]|nr:DUF3311 domain-containing protein [Candidatus Eremiobacteraeota bacterium]
MSRSRAWYAILVIPFAATLSPWMYNRADPQLFGLPFFYWYQLAWVPITSALLGITVYLVCERNDV